MRPNLGGEHLVKRLSVCSASSVEYLRVRPERQSLLYQDETGTAQLFAVHSQLKHAPTGDSHGNI